MSWPGWSTPTSSRRHRRSSPTRRHAAGVALGREKPKDACGPLETAVKGAAWDALKKALASHQLSLPDLDKCTGDTAARALCYIEKLVLAAVPG